MSTAATQLLDLEYFGLMVAPDAALTAAPDPDDQHVWDLLAVFPNANLITGDRLLLQSNDFPGRILSPREFVERYLADA
jgi:predicted nucleic acid-binding protein